MDMDKHEKDQLRTLEREDSLRDAHVDAHVNARVPINPDAIQLAQLAGISVRSTRSLLHSEFGDSVPRLFDVLTSITCWVDANKIGSLSLRFSAFDAPSESDASIFFADLEGVQVDVLTPSFESIKSTSEHNSVSVTATRIKISFPPLPMVAMQNVTITFCGAVRETPVDFEGVYLIHRIRLAIARNATSWCNTNRESFAAASAPPSGPHCWMTWLICC